MSIRVILTLVMVLNCGFISILVPASIASAAPLGLTFSLATDTQLVLDSNSPCIDGPDIAYVGFRLTNTTGSAMSGVQATLSGMDTNFKLAGGQAATIYIGNLANSSTRTAFWLIQYPCTAGQSKSLTITVTDSTAATYTSSASFTTKSSISANAGGQVSSATLGIGATAGQIIPYDVTYTFGSVSNADYFILQPVGNTDFDASCFQLVSTTITASNVTAIPVNTTDKLTFQASANQGGSSNTVSVRYNFLYLCNAIATTAKPYAAQTSGASNLKYTGNYSATTITFPPGTPAFTISKTASTTSLESGGTVTYTVTVTNTSSFTALLDKITDVLPTGATYTGLAGTSQVTAANSSSVPTSGATGTINWVGQPLTTYSVAAGATLSLVYTVSLPNTIGSYTNSVSATTGKSTTSAATATVGIGVVIPNISINNATVSEGNSGTTNATFTVTLSQATAASVTVNYATADITAVAPGDYTSTSGTLTFAPGDTSKTITVPVVGDTLNEPDETFKVNLSGATGGTITAATGTGTIQNDDAIPSLSIGNATQSEGNSGTTNANFTVTLSAASGKTITVHYATGDGTALAPGDYTSTSGDLTFAPGETSKAISVPVVGDTLNEADETFSVTLSSPTNATLGTATGTGTIQNDDAVPSLSINSPSITEGNSGNATMTFTVTLSAASGQTVTVNYASADNTAVSPGDYTAVSGALTFAPGETTKTINVSVAGDTVSEANETFNVNLSSPTKATILNGTGIGTIQDDDTKPTLSIDSPSASEGNSGTTSITFTVTLAAVSGQTVTVHYATADGTAVAPGDYTSTSGDLSFAPGETTKTITVQIVGDSTNEAGETFTVILSSPTNATIANGTGTGTIQNDDPAPGLSIDSPGISEGNSGTSPITFTVTLSAVSGQAVTVHYATSDGTATAPADYVSASGDLTFNPGETIKTIVVQVVGDTINETAENFTVTLSSAVNATIETGTGTGTIQNNDAAPSLSIDSPSASEGNSGSSTITFTVTLAAVSGQTVTVHYATADGTAVAPGDYTSASGDLTFNPGDTTKTIVVQMIGDTVNEANETFSVVLSSPSNATIGNGTGTGTILDDDALPGLSIDSPSVAEGNSGTGTISFTVTLSKVYAQNVTVHYASANGTAVAPADYMAASGDLTFTPGETTKTITVQIIGNNVNEPDKTFTVNLSGPVNAIIATPTGTATIQNDDGEPTLSINNQNVTEGNSGTTIATFTVTLNGSSSQTVTVHYSTADGTATAPGDYTATAGELSFAPGETTKTINVNINGDTEVEPNETFYVNLSGASGATIMHNQGLGTITGDDFNNSSPNLGIDNGVPQQSGGKRYIVFTVSLSAPDNKVVTVDYATANGTASAPGDYIAKSGTLTFAPGTVSQTIMIEIVGNAVVEEGKTFFINLSGATNGNITTPQGTGTIINVVKKKVVQPADLIAQLRVTPDRELPSVPDSDLTYTLVVKNVGPGKATDIIAQVPIDPNLFPAWTTFSNPDVWVEKVVTDVEQPYVQLRYPAFEPNTVVTSTLVFKTRIDNVPGSTIFTRATVKWSDDTSNNRIIGSNAVRFQIIDGPAKDETKGNVQFFSLIPSKTKPGTYTLFGDFFGPDEVVTLWYTGQDGGSVTLGTMRADATGTISYGLDPAKLPQQVNLVVAGFGNRTEIIGSISLSNTGAGSSTVTRQVLKAQSVLLADQKRFLTKRLYK